MTEEWRFNGKQWERRDGPFLITRDRNGMTNMHFDPPYTGLRQDPRLSEGPHLKELERTLLAMMAREEPRQKAVEEVPEAHDPLGGTDVATQGQDVSTTGKVLDL